VIDVSAFQMLLAVITAWLDRRERAALAYLMERTVWVSNCQFSR
jgi:hypothetical protein